MTIVRSEASLISHTGVETSMGFTKKVRKIIINRLALEQAAWQNPLPKLPPEEFPSAKK